MRTTLALDDDARKASQAYAQTNRVSLGKAASELVRRGFQYQLETRKLNGVPVFQVPARFPQITAERVRELLDEE
ncbi:MAG: antitoxin [Acidobacteriia bacterium]|nr:antitoxin [Terriglobia bacterium]